MKVLEWMKHHVVASLFLGFLGLFFLVPYFFFFINFVDTQSRNVGVTKLSGSGISRSMVNDAMMLPMSAPSELGLAKPVQIRTVSHEAALSLVVKNVKTAVDAIVHYAETVGGYMVNSSVSNPNEISSGTVVIRVPANRLKATLKYLREQSVQVVSESLSGEDITDQYTDIDTKLATLNASKKKFEAILEKAVTVPETLSVQQEVLNLQDQIDQLKGQKKYMEESVKFSRITINISTDELALPYAPNETWRPEVIFKQAFRSLVGTLRGLGSLLIWVVTYAVIWAPIVALIIYKKNHRKRA
jgi:hypothetical protein